MHHVAGSERDRAFWLGYVDGAYPDGEYPFNLSLYKGVPAWYYLAGYTKGTADRIWRIMRLGKY